MLRILTYIDSFNYIWAFSMYYISLLWFPFPACKSYINVILMASLASWWLPRLRSITARVKLCVIEHRCLYWSRFYCFYIGQKLVLFCRQYSFILYTLFLFRTYAGGGLYLQYHMCTYFTPHSTIWILVGQQRYHKWGQAPSVLYFLIYAYIFLDFLVLF